MVTESSSKRLWCCGTGAWVIAALVVWACAPSAYAQEACAVLEQDRTFPDCNGDGIEDVDDIAQGTSLDANGNQIPDECDFQICDDLWDGFQPNPPFSYTKQIGLIDYNGDGIYWDDPEGKGSIDKRGCGPNGRLDQTLKIGVHSDNPAAGYVQSEYFRTLAGELDCGASKYSLAFQFKTDVTIASEYDWLYDVFDGVSDSRVVQLAFTSLNSDVDPADRGYVLVKNPAGTPEWINTGVALSLGSCKDIEVVLDNINDAVYVYVEGELKVTTTRLTPDAYRMDYFKVNPIDNNYYDPSSDPELKLDEFRYCISGPVLMDWVDCNGNCVDDRSDISNGLDTDCNANNIPDFCEADQNCSCGSPATSVACMACNHEHEWDFDTESPAFVTGDLDCQKGWTLEQSSAYPAAEIVSASGLPSPMSGRAVKLNPRAGTAGDIPQGARGPRTRDEQPGMAASGDAGMEYWEVDVVVDEEPTSDGGDVMFVVWNMCDVFLNDDFGVDGVPACFSNTAPTCYRVTGGASSASVYARFNAGVRFRRWLGGDTKVEILSNGGWSQIVNGFHSRWYPDTVEHVNIRIDNNQDLITYWNGTHVVGKLDTNPVQSLGVDQNPNALGDRQVLLLNNSAICTAYFDNLTYTTDDECDRDQQPDSLLLPGGDYNYGMDSDTNEDGILDWCQDCNRNCIVDTDDIAGATSEDCNGNFIPDECDIDPSLPMYNMGPPSVGPECPPDWDDIGGYYTLKGGGSLDTDTNGVPDECQEDCNNNGTLDWCELDCDHVLCHPDGFPDLPGCGQADDCNGNNTPDDCEEDCNDNGVSDLCDITAGTSLDDNTNGAPDECDPDCDGNGTPDDIDMIVTPGYDCNTNGVLDRCEHTFPDCNGDDIEDACDIAAGTSLDGNGNGTPDECEPQPDIALESSLPDCDDSLWRCSNNFIRLTFDGEITDPSGAIQIRTLESGGTYGATDYSSNFTFTVVDDGFGTMRVLEIQENGSSFSSLLPDTTWIGVYAEPGAWFGVQGFSMHYMVQAGDVNNDGNVNFSGDAGLVYAHVGETGVPDETRWDLNGDHNVNFSGDAGCVYLHVGATPVPKPTGHVCP